MSILDEARNEFGAATNATAARPAEPRIGARSSGNMQRARAWVAKVPGAVAGQGGHDATWRVALACVGFGLDEEQTFQLLLGDYNPRCAPPWTERELRHKAKEAASARLQPGFKRR